MLSSGIDCEIFSVEFFNRRAAADEIGKPEITNLSIVCWLRFPGDLDKAG
jgi:hypothetical protein